MKWQQSKKAEQLEKNFSILTTTTSAETKLSRKTIFLEKEYASQQPNIRTKGVTLNATLRLVLTNLFSSRAKQSRRFQIFQSFVVHLSTEGLYVAW